uniref:hypothetical protein n=1 Tax=uncultured Boseongicola sp. TaxID=1648499 RepID=UPI002602AEDB
KVVIAIVAAAADLRNVRLMFPPRVYFPTYQRYNSSEFLALLLIWAPKSRMHRTLQPFEAEIILRMNRHF